MIIRQSALRHALHFARSRPLQIRFLSADPSTNPGAEAERTQSSLANSSEETHSIESLRNSASSPSVPPVEAELEDTAPDPASVVESAKDAYQAYKEYQKTSAHLGSLIGPHYQPHTLITNPPSPKDITLELLLASQTHLGHSTSLWKPANQRYIFGVRQGIHIISLDVTASHLRRAAKVVTGVCERGGIVLFVGTRDGQARCVVTAARRAGGCHLFERWIPGSITNGQQILGRGNIKVVDEFDREMSGYEGQLVDRPAVKPDLVVCLNPLENYVLLHECGLNNIPTIGIIDTDADPTWVTYPIPANDDSLRSVQVIAGVLGRAGEEGQQKRRKAAEAGIVTYDRDPSLMFPDEAKSARAGSSTAPVADDVIY